MQVIGSRIRLVVQVGVAVAFMVGLVVVSGSRSSSEPPRGVSSGSASVERERLEAAHRIEVLYSGIPQHGEVLGDPGAPVTLTFFGDPECIEARQFVLGALPFIVRRWVRDGKLRILYRSYPEETVWHGIFVRQAAAVLAAGAQGRLWQYLDLFYHRQGPEFIRYATASFLEGRAREAQGLDFSRWQAERSGVVAKRQLEADKRARWDYGLRPGDHRPGFTSRKTPAFFIGPTGGEAEPLLHFSLTESRAFDEAIEGVLGGRT